MVYQGSKNRLAKELVPIIQHFIDDNKVSAYIEPMVGGANLINKIQCKRRIGTDINPNVITLLRAIQEDKEISFAPNEVSFEHYREVRANQHTGIYSPEYVALIGYCASYGGRYFQGGYARAKGRDMYKERLSNLRKQAKTLQGIEFGVCHYKTYSRNEYQNCLFYLDPPYQNTKQYENQGFDYEEFYFWCKEMAKDNIILISEFFMPEGFVPIWSKSRKVLQKSDRIVGEVKTEQLFLA